MFGPFTPSAALQQAIRFEAAYIHLRFAAGGMGKVSPSREVMIEEARRSRDDVFVVVDRLLRAL